MSGRRAAIRSEVSPGSPGRLDPSSWSSAAAGRRRARWATLRQGGLGSGGMHVSPGTGTTFVPLRFFARRRGDRARPSAAELDWLAVGSHAVIPCDPLASDPVGVVRDAGRRDSTGTAASQPATRRPVDCGAQPAPAPSERDLEVARTAHCRKMSAGDTRDLIPSVHIDCWRGASRVVFSSRAFVAHCGHADGTRL